MQRGLLLRDDDFVARFRNAPERAAPPLRAVFIRACDRPARLAKLLDSLTGYEQRFGNKYRYVLVDDSTRREHADKQRDLLRSFARNVNCKAAYVGPSQTAKLVAKLGKARPHARDAIRTLLVRDAHPQARRFGGGRSRNIALLLSAGARMVLFDDDLHLPLRRPDFSQPGLDPDPEAPTRARFFADMSQALASGTPIDEDPLELHLDVCGQSLAACVNGGYGFGREALRGLNLSRLDALRPDARVITSNHGSYGSSRSESTLWLYHAIDPVSREDFWFDRESYERNINAHHVMFAAIRARVLGVPGFTPFAFDNSTMLPCTNPVGRAEDSLGSALTRYCHPKSVALELPVAVGHVQESLRKRFPITQFANPPRVNDFLREFVRRQFNQFKAEDPAQRLMLLAHVMRDLSCASVGDRVDHLREFTTSVHAEVIERLQRQLDAVANPPVYWQADVNAIVRANARALLAADTAPRLAEWPEDIDTAGCAQALSDELDSMAQMCEQWPTLWQYAAEQGQKLLSALD